MKKLISICVFNIFLSVEHADCTAAPGRAGGSSDSATMSVTTIEPENGLDLADARVLREYPSEPRVISEEEGVELQEIYTISDRDCGFRSIDLDRTRAHKKIADADRRHWSIISESRKDLMQLLLDDIDEDYVIDYIVPEILYRITVDKGYNTELVGALEAVDANVVQTLNTGGREAKNAIVTKFLEFFSQSRSEFMAFSGLYTYSTGLPDAIAYCLQVNLVLVAGGGFHTSIPAGTVLHRSPEIPDAKTEYIIQSTPDHYSKAVVMRKL